MVCIKKKTNITVFSGNLSGLGGLYGFTSFSKLHVSVLRMVFPSADGIAYVNTFSSHFGRVLPE